MEATGAKEIKIKSIDFLENKNIDHLVRENGKGPGKFNE